MNDGEAERSTDKTTITMSDAAAALGFADGLMQLFPELGVSICQPVISKVITALPTGKAIASPTLLDAAFNGFGRLLWANPSSFDAIFANDPNLDEKIASVVTADLSCDICVDHCNDERTGQKGAALSLCSAACRSPRVARVAGSDIVAFTRRLLEVEERSKLDLNALVEASCGTTRKVVGDGPLGDSAARTAEMLKSDPLLTVSLREALQNAEKAVASVS